MPLALHLVVGRLFGRPLEYDEYAGHYRDDGRYEIPQEQGGESERGQARAQHHLLPVGRLDLGDAFQGRIGQFVDAGFLAPVGQQYDATRGGVVRAEAGHQAFTLGEVGPRLVGGLGQWNQRGHQNIAMGFTGEPVVLCRRSGPMESMNSQRLRSLQACASSSRFALSRIQSPMATMPTW